MKNMLKKGLSLSLALLMCLTVSAAFVSCKQDITKELNKMDEPTRALELYKLVDEKMSALLSYTTEMEMHMTGTIQGQAITVEGTGEQVFYGDETTADFAYYSETNTKVTLEDLNTSVVTSSIEGFRDGKMFVREENNGAITKLWSPITATEYAEFLISKEEDSINPADWDLSSADVAAQRSCVQKDDGSWEIVYSSFSADAMKSFEKMVNEMLGEEGAPVLSDMKLTVAVTEDFYCTEMKLDFTFEQAESGDDGDTKLPTLTVTCEYGDFGTASPKEIDVSSYTEVEDLRVFYTVESEINRYMENEGYFKLKLDNKTSFAGQSNRYVETDIGRCGTGENGFFYEIDAVGGGDRYKITYAEGSQTIIFEDESSESTELTDADAKAFIKGLLDPAALTLSNISDITAIEGESGVYEIKLIAPNFSSLDETISQINGNGTSSSGSVIVTIKDGKLVEYVYEATIGVSSSYGFLKVTVGAICSYSDDTAFE